MKADITAPAQLINIKQLDDIPRGVAETSAGLTLGALTTLAEIEMHPAIIERYPALAEAAAVAATPQLRNMATLGGNLLQRPRCWYFRSPHFNCWLKGGEECQARDGENQHHALFGDSPCCAVHPSDLAPALLALGAEVRLRGQSGERSVPLAECFALPTAERRSETLIGDDELVLSVDLPAMPEGTRSTYFNAMDRKVWAFALAGVALVLRLGGPSGQTDRRCAAGSERRGAHPLARRGALEQALIGADASEALFASVADIALADAAPLAHNAYKIPLAKTLDLVERLLPRQ